MRWSLPILLAAAAAFVVGAALTMLSLQIGSPALAVVAIVAMVISMILFVLSIWRPRRRVDWDRIDAEQRLWESGPLGRSWLRTRRRLYDLWKF